MNVLKFTQSDMLEYIRNFNPTEYRYGIKKDDPRYYEVICYDKDNKPINLKKRNYSNMIKNTALIYNGFEKAAVYSDIYKNVLDKFILSYLQIPGLSSLYDEQYMEFEWNMHSNLDFDKHTNSYYRDHFVHEVRNMYMMLKLLEDEYISYNVRRVLTTVDKSKVSQYCMNQFAKWRNSETNHELRNKIISWHNIDGGDNKEEADACLKNYFFDYVTRASSIIACLFHDIGYPIAYYLSIKNRIINFIPSVYSIMGDNNFDFNYINSILSESVLFQFVGKDEIQKKFCQNDHGAISAILVGIFFYKTGAVNALPIEQRTAAELGILAMYNHTLKFLSCNPKAKTHYYRMNFALNPISYLLRLCDDIQEWEREYFYIASVSNLLYCQKCQTPLRKIQINCKDYYEKYDLKLNWDKLNETEVSKIKQKEQFTHHSVYWCDCCAKEVKNGGAIFVKRDDFSRRKLIEIKACESVAVTFTPKTLSSPGDIEIDLRYNPYKLLRMCVMQLSFFKYRIKEIVSLKKYVEGQSFLKNGKGYSYIYIKHNLTCNPMLLKMFILRDFFGAVQKYKALRDSSADSEGKLEHIKSIWKDYDDIECWMDYTKRLDNYYQAEISYMAEEIGINNKLVNDISENLSCSIIKIFYGQSRNNGSTDFTDIFTFNCKQYIKLLAYEYLCQKNKIHKSESKEDKIEIVYEPDLSWVENGVNKSIAGDDIRAVLYNDAVKQLKNAYAHGVSEQLGTKKYNNYLKEDDKIYYDVKEYCSTDAPLNMPDKIGERLTYYTDNYIFEKISYLTEILNGIINDEK